MTEPSPPPREGPGRSVQQELDLPGVAASLGGAARAAGRSTAKAVRRGRVFIRRGGAGTSGLAGLIELCTANAAGDALVTVALTTTVFFNVPIGQARGHVGLYLLITMAPFALLAPVIGPILDRLHGRRVALGVTLIARGVLCWLLAGHTKTLAIYPYALGLLMLSRAFSVARAAVTPRVLPANMTLVSANSRISLIGSLGGVVFAPIGLGIQALFGVTWLLRLNLFVFVAAALLAWQLPKHVDHASETKAKGFARAAFSVRPSRDNNPFSLSGLPTALRSVLPLRALVGFLSLFLAFRFYADQHSSKGALAKVALAAVIGSSTAIFIGNRLGKRRPELLMVIGLILSTGICVLGALTSYSTGLAFVVALVATFGGSFGKLGLDAVIQRDTPEETRSSAFARSETALQLAWVAGGALGLIPFSGREGFIVAAVGMTVALLQELAGLRGMQARIAHAPGRSAAPPDIEPATLGAVETTRPDPAGTLVLPFPEDGR
ncbi:MAG TPA: MFS transporter [Mycobacteriales bacterium]|nr:MFS transporter [Mycobacteriales bacterium]